MGAFDFSSYLFVFLFLCVYCTGAVVAVVWAIVNGACGLFWSVCGLFWSALAPAAHVEKARCTVTTVGSTPTSPCIAALNPTKLPSSPLSLCSSYADADACNHAANGVRALSSF